MQLWALQNKLVILVQNEIYTINQPQWINEL